MLIKLVKSFGGVFSVACAQETFYGDVIESIIYLDAL